MNNEKCHSLIASHGYSVPLLGTLANAKIANKNNWHHFFVFFYTNGRNGFVSGFFNLK